VIGEGRGPDPKDPNKTIGNQGDRARGGKETRKRMTTIGGQQKNNDSEKSQ